MYLRSSKSFHTIEMIQQYWKLKNLDIYTWVQVCLIQQKRFIVLIPGWHLTKCLYECHPKEFWKFKIFIWPDSLNAFRPTLLLLFVKESELKGCSQHIYTLPWLWTDHNGDMLYLVTIIVPPYKKLWNVMGFEFLVLRTIGDCSSTALARLWPLGDSNLQPTVSRSL